MSILNDSESMTQIRILFVKGYTVDDICDAVKYQNEVNVEQKAIYEEINGKFGLTDINWDNG